MSKINLLFLNIKNTLNYYGQRISEKRLIQFDYKVMLLLIFIIVCFASAVLFKVHSSSLSVWDQVIPSTDQNQAKGILFGKPKGIRSDEWVVNTPFALSQAQANPKFSLHNETLGQGNVPLLMNLPVSHVSTIFRPQLWGYFFLDIERGYAFFWDVTYLCLFLGCFFLFMLLTKNKFWLSIFGSLWICFSSFTLWWFSSAALIMGVASIIFVTLTYLILSKKKLNIVVSTILLTVFGIDFVLFLYPPYQVQLGYLILFLLAGFLIKNLSKEAFKEGIVLKVLCASAGAVVAVSIFYTFYQDARETMQLIMNTIYPGSRRSIGQGVVLSRYFSGFYSGLIRDGHVPKSFLNASEASNFILLFPVVLVGMIFNILRKQKNNILLWTMLLYIIIMTLWMKFGLPPVVAKVTLLSFAPTERCYMGLGLASIIMTVVFLGTKGAILRGKKQIMIVGSMIFIALLSYGIYLTSQTDHFFMYRYIILLTIGFTVASILLLQKKKLLFSLAILFVVVVPGIFVNPVLSGLGPLFDKDVTKVVQQEDRNNPKARWVVYGSRLTPNFFIAIGANVVDGVKYTPPFKDLKILDPEEKSEKVYNRYAHIAMSEKKVKGQEVHFDLVVPDHYVIHIDPCSPKLKQLGVTNLAFDKKPSDTVLECADPIIKVPVNNTWLYRYKK